ncbi:hypothetical protein [Bradyrhizobium macuxiense]|uniref:hypothetical protein n=1 Tax=Bradyrhizobium macuxiense TaxID=1755647 RepID=UPI000AD6C0F1|nr:hypothetical protein [Bradyrhizobium macuxiense]
MLMINRDELITRIIEAWTGTSRGELSAVEVVDSLTDDVRDRCETMVDVFLNFVGEVAAGERRIVLH